MDTTFKAVLESMDSNLWQFHFIVPEEIVEFFNKEKNTKRVVCTINNAVSYQCALMPMGNGQTYILLNKDRRKKLELELGDTIAVKLEADESEYGLPMPDELAELFKLDDEGSEIFHKLTKGLQRTLLHWVGTPKSIDGRIKRALAVVENLKESNGKPDFKVLNQKIKSKI